MRPAARLLLILSLLVLSIVDHAGGFGRRVDDRARYDGASAVAVKTVSCSEIEIDLPDGGRPRTRVRMLGVACIECEESETFLRSLLVGQKVQIALNPRGSARDEHGRLVAFVFLDDAAVSVNERMIADGAAQADRDVSHVLLLRFVDQEERARKRGNAERN